MKIKQTIQRTTVSLLLIGSFLFAMGVAESELPFATTILCLGIDGIIALATVKVANKMDWGE